MENMLLAGSAEPHEKPTGLEEVKLVSAAQKGDLEAFNQLVLRYQDRIFSLTLRMLRNVESAEDTTQDTFLKAYHSLPGFRNGSFRSWLYRIATNTCYDELRRNKRPPDLSLEFEDQAEERLLSPNDFPNYTNLPEREYERHELEQLIKRALDQLDADQRTVIVLVDLQDLDYLEAAQILSIPIGTVKSRLARARLRLRHLLTTDGLSSARL